MIILAKKNGRLVLPTPKGFGIGGQQNYYFSHMLNCLYDCRYCFLQGMYPSAHYVIFVNFEDFATEIGNLMSEHSGQTCYFFSGYDCDSLAFDGVTQFLDFFIPFFALYPQAVLELRTKSANIRPLLQHQPIGNCVVAFSLSPELVAQEFDHKAPPVLKRLQAMQQLAAAGWKIGLRFDPLIDVEEFEILYQQFIEQIFLTVPAAAIHSVSVGPLRFPQKMYQKIVKLYPREKLFAQSLTKRSQNYSYSPERELYMKNIVLENLQNYLNKNLLFECSIP